MRNLSLFLLLFVINSANANTNYGKFLPIEKNGEKYFVVLKWNSKEGIRLLEQAKYKQDFYQLASHFQPQQNALYCGIASSTIVLNAFRQGTDKIPQSKFYEIEKPEEFGGGYINFATYTQSEFLNDKTDKVKDKKIIRLLEKDPQLQKFDPGLTLLQLEKTLKSYNLNSKKYYALENGKKGLERFKKDLKKTLNQKDKFIIANFNGQLMGILSGGHISPIVAYNEMEQKIMVLDVASHKQPWWWGDIEQFYKAMQAKDGKTSRGYVLVSADYK